MLIEMFNISRYLDDSLSIDNICFYKRLIKTSYTLSDKWNKIHEPSHQAIYSLPFCFGFLNDTPFFNNAYVQNQRYKSGSETQA